MYFQQRPITDRRGYKMQNFISFLMVLIFFENFEKKILYSNLNIFLGGLDTLIIKNLTTNFFLGAWGALN